MWCKISGNDAEKQTTIVRVIKIQTLGGPGERRQAVLHPSYQRPAANGWEQWYGNKRLNETGWHGLYMDTCYKQDRGKSIAD